MATLNNPGRGSKTSLGVAQTGNVATTNVACRIDDRNAAFLGRALIAVTTTIGATPTVTMTASVSMDGVNFTNINTTDIAGTSAATFVITTATTTYRYIPDTFPWLYIKLTSTANTNVTFTTDVYCFTENF